MIGLTSSQPAYLSHQQSAAAATDSQQYQQSAPGFCKGPGQQGDRQQRATASLKRQHQGLRRLDFKLWQKLPICVQLSGAAPRSSMTSRPRVVPTLWLTNTNHQDVSTSNSATITTGTDPKAQLLNLFSGSSGMQNLAANSNLGVKSDHVAHLRVEVQCLPHAEHPHNKHTVKHSTQHKEQAIDGKAVL